MDRPMIIKVPESDLAPHLSEADKLDLKTMQSMVGGLIEPVTLDEKETTLWCNQEGKLIGLPLNRLVKDEWGQEWDINGPFFICGTDKDGDAVGLTIEQATLWLALLKGREGAC